MKYILALSIMELISFKTYAQVSGTISDSKSKKALAQVEVFIDGTSYITQSDDAGTFVLNGLPLGFADLVLYKKGYQLFKSSIRVQEGKAYVLNLALEASEKEKMPKGSEAKNNQPEFQKFKEVLFGKENMTTCLILNEEILSFSKIPEGTVVKATAPLVITNNTLGLQLHYYLQDALLSENKSAHRGFINFRPLPLQSSDQMELWTGNRLKAYQGSSRHLFQSLAAGNAEQQGFEWRDKKGDAIQANTLIAASNMPGYHKLVLGDTLNVRYKTQDGAVKSTQLIQHGSLEINTNGKLLNEKNLTIGGDMGNVSLSAMLPHDYQPSVSNQDSYSRFYENVYVHTEKPYYYPGEPMWFKGYINYREPTWRDSLSEVIYVELINPKKELRLVKTLKIDSGIFHNDFILPDTLKAGTYYLRAYTNLNRNFGDSSLFVKTIRILNITDKVDRLEGRPQTPESSLVTITSDKKKYKTRERITLSLQGRDKEGRPVSANLSLSVTDVSQVVPLAEPQTILNSYPFNEKKHESMGFKYPMEYGISFSGRFLNDKGKPEKTALTILQAKPRNLMLVETSEQGIFLQTGLDFYDTATFSVKSDKAKNSPYGKIELLPREIPPMNFKISATPITVQSTQSQQRIISEYEVPSDARMLEGVEVKASRIEEQQQKDYRVKRPFGQPDYVLTAKDINTSYGNLLFSLQGKIPGLIVRQTDGGWVVYLQRSLSISNPAEVLVTVNDNVVGGSPGTVLGSIDPNTVESIEVKKGVNVLYGSFGGNGILAVYTKQGADPDLNTTSNFQTIKIAGYSSSRKFKFPDYDNKDTDTKVADYRSTIYWNPNVVTNVQTGSATVSFFAADLPGTYRIVGEGILQNGEPVRCEYTVTIESD
jgi:hypothetical protein